MNRHKVKLLRPSRAVHCQPDIMRRYIALCIYGCLAQVLELTQGHAATEWQEEVKEGGKGGGERSLRVKVFRGHRWPGRVSSGFEGGSRHNKVWEEWGEVGQLTVLLY